MPVQTCPDKLADLLDYLDRLTARASVAALSQHLRALKITAEDLTAFVRFSEHHYVRSLIRSGPWYHLLVMCWRSGQRSPIHDHASSTCGFRILRGLATETKFERTPCSQVKAVSSGDYQPGDVGASQDAQIHQVSNLQTRGRDLVTLHVYSPPLLRMNTYSLTDRTVGEFRPVILEHADGSGI